MLAEVDEQSQVESGSLEIVVNRNLVLIRVIRAIRGFTEEQ